MCIRDRRLRFNAASAFTFAASSDRRLRVAAAFFAAALRLADASAAAFSLARRLRVAAAFLAAAPRLAATPAFAFSAAAAFRLRVAAAFLAVAWRFAFASASIDSLRVASALRLRVAAAFLADADLLALSASDFFAAIIPTPLRYNSGMRINVALRDPGGGATGGNDDAQDAPADDVADAVDEHPTEPDAVTGIDPLQSRLWAQVRKGEPAMTTDADGRLRHRNWPDSHGSLFLGDVCEALLRCFGAHEPPQVTEQPGLDQQRWTIVITDGVLDVTVRSRSYWGWGLFNRCFLNEIVLTGPLERRSRLMFDLTSALGRNPWEASMGIFWRKATRAGEGEHRSAWQELIAHANEHMNEEIHTYAHRLENLHGRMEEYEQGNHPGWERGAAEELLRLSLIHI